MGDAIRPGIALKYQADITLREDSQGKGENSYYAILKLYVKQNSDTVISQTGSCRIEIGSAETELVVPITKKYYDRLKQSRDSDEGESARLNAEGELEIKLRNVCMN